MGVLNSFFARIGNSPIKKIARGGWSGLELTDILRAIFCKSHPTCDSRVFIISSYFNQLKIKVILEHGRNFSFIKHFVKVLGRSRDDSSFSRNAISVHKLYFESPSASQNCFSEFELLLHEPCQGLNTI